jgi:phosphoenolpyruvate-protein phosphotransferase (PTS system enzyme I)
MSEEKIIDGLAVSGGIAMGPAWVLDTAGLQVAEVSLAADAVSGEITRFNDAVQKAIRQIKRVKAKASSLPGAAAEEMNILLDAHMAMLSGSRLIRGVEKRIASEKINAESAVQKEMEHLAASFAAMTDTYLASRVEDIREAGRRLLRNLTSGEGEVVASVPEGSILIAEDITPADTAQINPQNVHGIVAELGGIDGHSAIMARALDLPAVMGATGLRHDCAAGDMVIVDGSEGKVIVRPSQATLQKYRRLRDRFRKDREALKNLRKLPAITSDGAEIMLMANLELPREVDRALEAGAQGVGLLRTEFLFMNRNTLPDENEQFEAMKTIIQAMNGKLVTIRTLDLGGEKLSSAVSVGESTNPALGLRAIRLCLRQPKLLETQFAAILRAAHFGPVRILIPMISSVDEIKQVREKLVAVHKRLQRRGDKVPDELPPLGVMIEIPGAALSADALTQVCDFFSIGSNDLTQYTLAIDRADEQVAALYNPLHPAVLRLIQFTTEAALRARIPISLCGEMAGDPRLSALLIGLGIRELSMAPSRLPEVKRMVRGLNLLEATTYAGRVMAQSSEAAIKELIEQQVVQD